MALFFNNKHRFVTTVVVCAYFLSFFAFQNTAYAAAPGGCGLQDAYFTPSVITDNTDTITFTAHYDQDCVSGTVAGGNLVISPPLPGTPANCDSSGTCVAVATGISVLPNGTYPNSYASLNATGGRPYTQINATFTINRGASGNPCSINSFTPAQSSVTSGGATTLNFSLSGSYPWSITLLAGAVSPSPASGNNNGGSVGTGNLTTTQIYQLNCGSATAQTTVTVNASSGTADINSAWQYNFSNSIMTIAPYAGNPGAADPAPTNQETFYIWNSGGSGSTLNFNNCSYNVTSGSIIVNGISCPPPQALSNP